MTTFRKRAASAALILSANLAAFSTLAGPGQALGAARQQLASGDCRAAVRTLDAALPEAAAIGAEKERGDALAALHFYSAVAQSDCSNRKKAEEHLRHFFELRPGQSSLDKTKYKRAFLDVFDAVQRDLTSGGEMFDRFYPGFDAAAATDEETRLPLGIWATSAAFQILATDEEREAWGRLRDDDARAAFVDTFWNHRDPDPATGTNELRALIAQRVAFADQFFVASNELRGAMTDRGRVFVLLGPPARVHRQALQRYQTTFVTPRERTPLNGTMERWVYFKPQLVDVATQQVEFRFITQPGYGEYVMQRDFWPLKAMGAARQARR
jgi:GWxTD domain-containing protein